MRELTYNDTSGLRYRQWGDAWMRESQLSPNAWPFDGCGDMAIRNYPSLLRWDKFVSVIKVTRSCAYLSY